MHPATLTTSLLFAAPSKPLELNSRFTRMTRRASEFERRESLWQRTREKEVEKDLCEIEFKF